MANGLQSGLGYGETTAADQLAAANATLATSATTLREARRVYVAYQDLYANKAISRDQLDQAQAQFEQAQVAYNHAADAGFARDAADAVADRAAR